MIRRSRLRAGTKWRKHPKVKGAPQAKGRPALSPAAYRALRIVVLTRDKHKCRHCGSGQYPQVHHVKKRSAGGPDVAENLVTLCGGRDGCHDATDRAYVAGRLVVTSLGGGEFQFKTVRKASKWSPDPAA
jgi:hypothetical protein